MLRKFDKGNNNIGNILEKMLSIICLVLLISIYLTTNVESKVQIQISTVIDKDSVVDSPNTVNMIIGFKDKVEKNDLDLIHGNGAKIKHILKEINAVSVRIPPQALNGLRKNPKIKYITENNKGINISTQSLPWGVDKIDAELVHPQNKGTGVIVAVTDTGIDYNHEDLIGRVIGGWDYVNNDPDPMDDFGHGTHVAGTIAANDNSIGVIGVAPEASLLNMKMLDQNGGGYWDDAAASVIDSANSGAKIISMSWSGCTDDPTLRAAIQYASAQGVLLVAAAGNDYGGSICWPAAYPEVMAITATDINDNIADFSSIGTKAEISAPGVNIFSTVPTGSCNYCDPSGYALLSGTSMATPHVSGTAALIWSVYPTLTASQVRKRITDYAIDLGVPGRDPSYGFGRLNAYASVNQNPPPPPAPPFYMMVQPKYSWIDGIIGGTQIQFNSQDDGVSNPINLGMNFNFYGTIRNQLWVSTNGLIAFDNDGSQNSYFNRPIPNTNTPNNFMSVYWDDLYLDNPGSAYYKLDTSSSPKKLIITWQNVRLYSGSARTTFEAVLYEDGRILYQYQQPSLFESDGETVGIEDVGGTRGQQFKYNEPINDYSAVLFTPMIGSSISVTSPNGGEIWQSGSTKTVKWSYTGNPGSTVNVDLLKSGVLVKTIASGISIGSSGNGTYSWKMDTGRTPGTDYKIRVTSTSNSAYTDMSDNNFTITGPIIVTSPNGGENWRHGTSHTITWSKAGSSGSYVKIELLRSGSAVKTITSSTSNDGSYSWSISSTQTVASDYQIRITSTSNSAYKDTSDNYFTIST